MTLRHIFTSLSSVLLLIFTSCQQNYFVADGSVFGTTYHIVYRSAVARDSLIKEQLRLVDDELSMFNPTSVVSAVNDNRLDSVTEAFKEVFAISQQVSSLSSGAYDPTVAPLCDIWGFGRKKEIEAEPSDSIIAAVLQSVGIRDCAIVDNRIVKKSPDTAFDFSSVAKGYAVDCVARAFDAAGIEDYLIEIGGEIVLKGLNPKGRKWHIQLDAPTMESHERLTTIAAGPEPLALASSGNYRNFRRDSNGKIFGHTLSPISGRPVQGSVLAASVFAADCATADALATAAMAVAHPDSAIALMERAGAQAIIVAVQNDSITIIETNQVNNIIK